MASREAPEGGIDTIYTTGRESTGWWAIVMLVMIEAALTAAILGSYFYFFANVAVWPPAGIEEPDLLLPTLSSAVLIGSIVPTYIGDRALAHGSVASFRLWSIVGVAMVLVVLALRYLEYSGLDYRWDDTVYGSIVWLIFGFHTLNVVALVLMALGVLVLAWRAFFTDRRRSAVQGLTLFWLFVVVSWVALYAAVYLFPNYAEEF